MLRGQWFRLSTVLPAALIACWVWVTFTTKQGQGQSPKATEPPAAPGVATVSETLGKLEDTVSALAFSSDGKYLASGASHKSVKVWDLQGPKPKVLAVMQSDHNLVNDLLFSPDGKWLASLDLVKDRLRLWNMAESPPKEVIMPVKHQNRLCDMAIAPDGKTLATSGGRDLTIRLWELTLPEPKEKAVIRVRGDVAYPLAFSPDSNWLAAGVGTRTRLWNLKGAKPEEQTVLRTEFVGYMGFSPDGKMLATGEPSLAEGQRSAARNLKVKYWDLSSNKLAKELVYAGKSKLNTAALVPDLKTLVMADVEGRVTRWEALSGKKLEELTLASPAEVVRFAPDGRSIATGGKDGTIHLIRFAQ